MAWLSGPRSWSRFFRSCSVARRADRGPSPGSLDKSAISRSISGPADAATQATLEERHPLPLAGRGQRVGVLAGFLEFGEPAAMPASIGADTPAPNPSPQGGGEPARRGWKL